MNILFRNLCICFVILAVCAGCSKKASETKTYDMPDYHDWKQAAPIISGVDFPDHIGTVRRIYANDTAYESVVGLNRDVPVVMKTGSILVKESFSSLEDMQNGSPLFVTLMEKDPSNSFEKNGWLFVKQDEGQGAGKYITGRYCSGCHEAANETHLYFDGNPDDLFRDYLFIRLE